MGEQRDFRDPERINGELLAEGGIDNDALRRVCREERLTRVQAIERYGDPRNWEPFDGM